MSFPGSKWSICSEKFFFGTNHYYYVTFIYLLNLFIAQNLKKFLRRIQSYKDAQFLGPKWHISPNENFFRKPVSEPCFFHSYLSTCQKSKSDINLLLKYWQLNTEISLAKSHFGYNLRTRFFPSMQFSQWTIRTFILHKFKTKRRDFLKKSKNHVFRPFLVIFARSRFFSKTLMEIFNGRFIIFFILVSGNLQDLKTLTNWRLAWKQFWKLLIEGCKWLKFWFKNGWGWK